MSRKQMMLIHQASGEQLLLLSVFGSSDFQEAVQVELACRAATRPADMKPARANNSHHSHSA